MKEALMKSETGIIAEFKRKSPKQGMDQGRGKGQYHSSKLSAEWGYGAEYPHRHRLLWWL